MEFWHRVHVATRRFHVLRLQRFRPPLHSVCGFLVGHLSGIRARQPHRRSHAPTPFDGHTKRDLGSPSPNEEVLCRTKMHSYRDAASWGAQ